MEESRIRTIVNAKERVYNTSMYCSSIKNREFSKEEVKSYRKESLEYRKILFLATCKPENKYRTTMTQMRKKEKYCCCCGDGLPIVEDPGAWEVGKLRSLHDAEWKVKLSFPHGLDGTHGGGYLCGGCYLELTDESQEGAP